MVRLKKSKKQEPAKKTEEGYVSEKAIKAGDKTFWVVKRDNHIQAFDGEDVVFDSNNTDGLYGSPVTFQAWLKAQKDG